MDLVRCTEQYVVSMFSVTSAVFISSVCDIFRPVLMNDVRRVVKNAFGNAVCSMLE